jgi:hypothetical protein
MTIHTVRLDIITTIEQHRSDTIIITNRRHISINIMAIAISRSDHLISIAPIASSRRDLHINDHLRRSIIIDLPQREVVDNIMKSKK